ncbi:MAG: hypothetical protein ABJC04_10985 [Verrucomicrobiota bacterium]
MKNNQPNDDETLRASLLEWKENAPLPPRFQEQVWRRIERAETKETAPRWNFLKSIEMLFARPAFAMSYVAILLAVGMGAGFWQVERKSAKTDSTLERLYVQSVDPYQAPRH